MQAAVFLLGTGDLRSDMLKQAIIVFCLLINACLVNSQTCNPNIDFEEGTFKNWVCSAGTVDTSGNLSLINTFPLTTRHTLISSLTGETDHYGLFPVSSPNGSKYCVKLGNDSANAEAERISYTFTIPPDENDYSIIYSYAVVFQEPGHKDYQQPRFTSKVVDVSTNQYIACGSFNFVAASTLPGFQLSGVASSANVFYRTWSSVTVKIVGYQGKTMRLEFTTNDCALGGHFGYAYVDLLSTCNATLITGNTYCGGTQSLTLTGPEGFASYNWFTTDFSTILGNTNTLSLKPIPPVGTGYALELIPYPGLGCTDTLYTSVEAKPDPFIFIVPDSVTGCLPTGLPVAAIISPYNSTNILYKFYTDSSEATEVNAGYNIIYNSKFYIRATNPAGCTDVKPVAVQIFPVSDFVVTNPPAIAAPQTVNLQTTVNDPTKTFSFWKDSSATQQINNATTIEQSGVYYIRGTDKNGCSVIEPVKVIISSIVAMPSAFSPNADGKNDVLRLIAKGGIRQLSYFKIFDRWGHLVFSTNNAGSGWDGTFNGKAADTGTYVWMIRATDYAGTVFEKKGTVVLVR